MKAGFHTADITPALGMEAPGGYGKVYIRQIHDPLKVRAAVFESGGETIGFLGIDTCYLQSAKVVGEIRRQVEERCGIPGDHLLLASSHTHSGGPGSGRLPEEFADAPELVRELALNHSTHADPLYCDWLTRQGVTALCEAYRKREEALLSVGSGHEDQVAFNRRFRMANGRVYTHPGKGNPEIVEPAGPTDPEVGVLAAWNSRGELLGCLVNYACHATVFGAGVSADYIAYLEETIQAAGTHEVGGGRNAVVVFLQGASGDMTQVDNRSLRAPEFGEKWSRLVGTRIGAEVVKVLVTATRGKLEPLAAVSKHLRIPRRPPSPARLEASRRLVEEGLRTGDRSTAWTFAKELLILDYLIQQEPEAEVKTQALQVGPTVFLANPAEYFCESGLAIKRASPFALTYIVTLANGCVGYVPPEAAFAPDGGGYETVLTSYSNLALSAAQQIADASLELAGRLTPGTVPQPPQVDQPQEPWSYGVLGPDRE
jgi:neutral ceramidase